ncbi:hypothetical protein [Actinomadura bangladeshensis]|uniref:Uncharacterized protein n=1 Tax=Actinomadura bangladeshensis TaxID=453573 RepID=A0A6L9QC12_9ACTN|nr:hypothetical protein [Actinomadura bangladeshensis]NEA23019.1 hypothetical protein [Actinomadura bangladeshensis]
MSKSTHWRGYSSEEIEALSDWHIFDEELEERECPHCHRVRLRIYMYKLRDTGSLATQIWCPHCHSYSGWTGPYPPKLSISDPLENLPTDEFADLNQDEDTLFECLDALWADGVLPQQVTRG